MSGPRWKDAGRYVFAGSKVVVGGAWTLARMARSGQLRESIRPWMRFERAIDVPFDLLCGQGIEAVLFDLENTLIPPGGPFTDEGRQVLASARGAGLRVGVVTNCSAEWARQALREERLPAICPAGKPAKRAFVEACRMLGVKPSRTVFVGDQYITDVFGAQRAGIRAILLEPRYRRESLSSKFQRAVAKGILRVTGEGRQFR